jgi:TonB family protein
VKERLHTPDLRRDVVLIAQAQASPGKVNSATRDQSLWGMVIDPSGKGVAAAVLLTDAGGATRTVNTDSGGVYRFPDVVPGTYSVTVNAPGFKRETQTGVAVAAGETHAMGAMFLQLGSISTSITITGSSSAPVATALPPANGPKTDEERRQFVEQFRLRRDSDGTIRTVTAANLVNPIKPAYPADLQQQGVQGTVKIEAILSKNGVLENIRWINRGEVNESLAMHALDALRQWLYGPTLLNGQPVEVLTMIDVNFELRD